MRNSTVDSNLTDPDRLPIFFDPNHVVSDECLTAPVWEQESACRIPRPTATPEPATPGIPAVTITDVATFAPAPIALTAEPFNVAVAGLPANFVAPATVHTVTGTLFDTPLTVEFTPARFTFDYGDGTTITTKHGGYTWESKNLPQFTPTITTHVYKERGTVTATATIHYTAAVDFGTGWIPLDGELTIPTPGQSIRIYEAHTALVKYDCNQDPDGIGCPGT